MKNRLLHSAFLGIVLLFSSSVYLNAQVAEPFIGEWNFECPDAPEGFNTGIIEIKRDTIFTRYSSFSYKFPSTWVKMSNDTLIYPTDVNDEIVTSRLIATSPEKLTGTAGTLAGTSLLILTRRNKTETESAR